MFISLSNARIELESYVITFANRIECESNSDRNCDRCFARFTSRHAVMQVTACMLSQHSYIGWSCIIMIIGSVGDWLPGKKYAGEIRRELTSSYRRTFRKDTLKCRTSTPCMQRVDPVIKLYRAIERYIVTH